MNRFAQQGACGADSTVLLFSCLIRNLGSKTLRVRKILRVANQAPRCLRKLPQREPDFPGPARAVCTQQPDAVDSHTAPLDVVEQLLLSYALEVSSPSVISTTTLLS